MIFDQEFFTVTSWSPLRGPHVQVATHGRFKEIAPRVGPMHSNQQVSAPTLIAYGSMFSKSIINNSEVSPSYTVDIYAAKLIYSVVPYDICAFARHGKKTF